MIVLVMLIKMILDIFARDELMIILYRVIRINTVHVNANEIDLNHPSSMFICVDGTEVPLLNVCDGFPNCPDSSDEIETLCRHIVCPIYMYRCSYGACVIRTARCNGSTDCIDASDEFACDRDSNDICSDREFQCSTSHRECIPLGDMCNGYEDCSDGSDENTTICHGYPCPEYMFRCSYGGCIHQELVCDGVKDCVDGADEDSSICQATDCEEKECEQYKCRKGEFACKHGGQCLPTVKVCDGTLHCRDASDESSEVCKERKCPENWFRCSYGGCIRPELKCNLQLDCYDWSDEDESLCKTKLPNGACRLPAVKTNTRYVVNGCSKCRPGEIVPELTRLDYDCNSEESLEGPSKIYCQNNQWLPAVPNCTVGNQSKDVTCLASFGTYGAIKRCQATWGLHKGWLPCNRPLPVGTRVFLECPDFYERRRGSSSIACLHDGTWNQVALSCTPICGMRESTAAVLIVKGWSVESGETLPWHATLFSQEIGQWKFFCGGTLIAERVVLTAGHCVWKTVADTIRVAFGLPSSDLKEMNGNTQVIDVASIEIPDAYQDYENNYGSDIALLILRKAVAINSYVRPVCVNWHSDATLVKAQENGELGLVAGMGLTENDTFSSVLRVTTMKIVSDDVCRQKLNKDFRKYITYTSFCAGWTNGTAVCNGDSGGGLVLQRSNSSIWEVHGVVSVSPRKLGTSICDPNFYAVFTKVSMYANWINKIVESIPVIGPPDLNKQPNQDGIIV